MRIALRTSGGRGEYELTGAHAGVQASELFGRRLTFQITPEITLDGRSRPLRVQGKPRIRLEDGGRHAYRVFADVLLLPLPRRELRQTADGPNFVRDRGYAVGDIDVDLVQRNGQAELRPTRLWLTNAEGLARGVEFAERMASVQAVWEPARGQDGRLAGLVRAHEEAVETGDHGAIGTAAAAIRREFGTGTDVLPLVAAGLGADLEEPAADGSVVTVEEIPEEPIEDETDPAEAVRREIFEVAQAGREGRRRQALRRVGQGGI